MEKSYTVMKHICCTLLLDTSVFEFGINEIMSDRLSLFHI